MGKRWVAMQCAGLGVVAMLAACQRSEPPEDTAGEPAPAVATTAPSPTAPAVEPAAPVAPGPAATPAVPSLQIDTLDGTRYDLAAHRGKWVVVNFWATWCAPCLKEMPELSALDAMHEHIEVIGLAYEDIGVEAMRDFLETHPVMYPVAIVDTYAPPADFETPRGLPMTYLIAPDGTVARRVVGPVTAREIEDAIAAGGGPAAAAGDGSTAAVDAGAATRS